MKKNATKKKVKQIVENPELMNVFAPSYDPYDGYGRMGLELIYHLDKLGLYVNAAGGGNTQRVWETQTAHMQGLMDKPIKPMLGGFLLGYPTLHEKFGGLANSGVKVAITMFESTALPDGWMQALNECDAVIVPAKWLVKVFKRCGVYKPIHVVPLGISETFMVADRRERYRAFTKRNPFTFLTWGDRGNRKGWDIAAQAFVNAFGDRQDVKMIIKARDGSFFYKKITNDNIEILGADLDEFELRDLYLRCDAMVFPSRCEGFGLPPREFAATGGPAIVTEFWADDISQWGYPVHYDMVKAWEGHPAHDGLGKWAEPRLEHLVKQMKHVVEQKQHIIHYMGQQSARHVAKLYSWERFAGACLDVWKQTANRVAKKNKRKSKRNGAKP